MRELKFRGWDKEQKKMYYIDLYEYMAWNEMKQDEVMSSKAIKNGLMQFTGLKDKNGKEIYEGDILRIKDHPDSPAWGGIGFVFWDNEELSYFYGVKDGLSDLLCTPDKKQLEVIGNIYENPEILNS